MLGSGELYHSLAVVFLLRGSRASPGERNDAQSIHFLSAGGFSMDVFEQKNSELVTEFDRYVREHPDFAERIPNNALVAVPLEGDEELNRWSEAGAKRQAETGRPIVYVKIKGIQRIRSRIQEVKLSA